MSTKLEVEYRFKSNNSYYIFKDITEWNAKKLHINKKKKW